MGRYIAFHVNGDPEHPRKATPISTGMTREEALASAVQRLLTLPRTGYVDVQDRNDVGDEEFARLTATLDTYFSEHMFGSRQ